MESGKTTTVTAAAAVKKVLTKRRTQRMTSSGNLLPKEPSLLPRVLFNSHDLDESGGISTEEFRGLIYSLGYYMNEEELKIAISSVDTNGDGEVSLEEFMVWWESDDRFRGLRLDEAGVEAVQRASDFFQYYDTEDKGYVTAEQFETMFDYMKQWPGYFREGVTIEEAFQEIKSDYQGAGSVEKVSFNDYLRWLINIGSIQMSATAA
ncbi:hypothetical protein DFJ73DRAFT_867320 [Zopfochytrium polystomum]|nr:hypothetical protein DFJ73DRAFT_867320 [Zopfochytrium polystomum]